MALNVTGTVISTVPPGGMSNACKVNDCEPAAGLVKVSGSAEPPDKTTLSPAVLGILLLASTVPALAIPIPETSWVSLMTTFCAHPGPVFMTVKVYLISAGREDIAAKADGLVDFLTVSAGKQAEPCPVPVIGAGATASVNETPSAPGVEP